ncbi:MAG: insulinase family protein [Candidatus Kapabacteria bacterium]|nr:insulinase family protein [Candidatus Kapabacteria bacterium]
MIHTPLRASVALVAMMMVLMASSANAQLKPLVFKEYDLPNGLHVVLHEDHSAPVVATVLHYVVGSRDEDPQRTGFAHFFEHLMFEATDKIERGTIDKLINGAGGQLNAFTNQDATVYHFVVPSNQVRLALWIEAQRMRKLKVNEIGVETQRGVVKEERKNRYDNAPYGGWYERQLATLFAGTPYAWAPIGSAQHIDVATIPEFEAFYSMYYQPNNAVLVVSGDFDEKLVRETIDAYFGGYPRGADPKRPVINEPTPLGGEKRETIQDTKAQLPALFISYRGIGAKEEDAYAMEILGEIMSSGESSRLYRSIVDSLQVGVQVQLGNSPREYSGLTNIIGIAAPGKGLEALEKAIDDQIALLLKDGVTDEELVKAKNIIEARFVAGRTGVYEKALAMADAWRFMKNVNMVNTELEQYMKVTKADILRVARRVFGAKDRSVLTYIPSKG